MTYSVHYRHSTNWHVRDFEDQAAAQEFARMVNGIVNVIINLHAATMAAMVRGV